MCLLVCVVRSRHVLTKLKNNSTQNEGLWSFTSRDFYCLEMKLNDLLSSYNVVNFAVGSSRTVLSSRQF